MASEDERTVTIKISAKNLTEAEFKQVKVGLGGIEKAADKTNQKTSKLGRGISAFSKAAPGALRVVTAGIGAAAAAATGAAAGFAMLASRGTELAGVADSFQGLAAAAGESATEIIAQTNRATQGMVSDVNIMAAANKGLLLGLPITASSMGDLSKSAIILGKAMKQDAGKSLDDLITALGRSSPLILDNLGLTVKVGEANEAYAAKLGKSVSQLSEADKKMAFYEATVEAARVKVDEIGESQLTLADRFQQTKVFLTNILDGLSIGIAKSPVFSAALGSINDMMQGAFGGDKEELVLKIVNGFERAAFFAIGLGQAGITAAQMVTQGFAAIKAVVLGVATGLVHLNTMFLETSTSILEMASHIPITGDLYAGLAEKTQLAAEATAAVGASLQAELDASLAAAAGNDTLGLALTGASEALDKINQKMIEKGLSTQVTTQATQAETVATVEATGANVMLGESIGALTPYFEKQMADLQLSNEAWAMWGENTNATVVNVDAVLDTFTVGVGDLAGAVAADAARMSESFGFFGLQTRAELAKTSEEAAEHFEKLKESGELSATELDKIWKEYAENRKEDQESTSDFVLTSEEALFQGTSQLLAQMGGKFKAAAIATAIISTYQAIAKALASAPWPASLVLAAGAAAAGFANVAKIKSAKPHREGTPGLDFADFGTESLISVHGRESIVPQGGGHQLGREVASELARMRPADQSGMVSEGLRDMSNSMKDLPVAIQRAVRDGILLTGKA